MFRIYLHSHKVMTTLIVMLQPSKVLLLSWRFSLECHRYVVYFWRSKDVLCCNSVLHMDLKKFGIPILFFCPVILISQNHILALLFHILNTSLRISLYLFGTADMLMSSFWRRRQSNMQYYSVNLNYMLANSRF